MWKIGKEKGSSVKEGRYEGTVAVGDIVVVEGVGTSVVGEDGRSAEGSENVMKRAHVHLLYARVGSKVSSCSFPDKYLIGYDKFAHDDTVGNIKNSFLFCSLQTLLLSLTV